MPYATPIHVTPTLPSATPTHTLSHTHPCLKPHPPMPHATPTTVVLPPGDPHVLGGAIFLGSETTPLLPAHTLQHAVAKLARICECERIPNELVTLMQGFF